MSKFFETNLWGVLSVPFTLLLFIACGVATAWVCHWAATLTWLLPS